MFYNLKWYKNKLGLQYLTILKIYNNKSKMQLAMAICLIGYF